MRIGIDARMLGFTGVGRYIKLLLEGLSQVDDRNEYVLFVVDERCLDCVRLPANSVVRVVRSKPFSLSEQVLLSPALKRENLDLFHYPHWNVPLAFFGKLVLTIHDLTPLIYPDVLSSRLRRLVFPNLLRMAAGKANRIIAVSENTRSDIERLLAVENQKITVIHEAVAPMYCPIADRGRLRRATDKYNLPRRFILYVGQWKPNKNICGLLRACHSLVRADRMEHDLVIAGAVDNRYIEVPNLVKSLGLGDRVLFTGYVADEDLPALYNLAELVVMPSLYEGFGLPVLEAMACGTPVVCSNTSSFPEVARDAALLIDPLAEDRLADAIHRGLTDTNLRHTLIERGFKRAKTFSVTAMAEKTIAVYEDVMSRGINN